MGMPVEQSRHEECRAETSRAMATNTACRKEPSECIAAGTPTRTLCKIRSV
ncbi:hypothetical protein T4A_10410 [Trichinella pseudospiralis]|uniref:Uncharacterized protein n=1 Tax=Trichinella pseudospiralis TaxID=6337 RepID=A0A0V1C3M6_TRIPS|nr:hypothetical protein T4A_10410 [Trichinella pseudospiralis]